MTDFHDSIRQFPVHNHRALIIAQAITFQVCNEIKLHTETRDARSAVESKQTVVLLIYLHTCTAPLNASLSICYLLFFIRFPGTGIFFFYCKVSDSSHSAQTEGHKNTWRTIRGPLARFCSKRHRIWGLIKWELNIFSNLRTLYSHKELFFKQNLSQHHGP